MSAALSTAGLRPCPEPSQGRQDTRTNPPVNAARFLGLVRWIIAYGQELSGLVQRGVNTYHLSRLSFSLHTNDLAVMLARVTRGLMLAAGLETKLRNHVVSGRDVMPARLPSISERRARNGSTRAERPARPLNVIDLPLDRLPTAAEIAAELQRRPIGAIIVDICRDLGIRPGDLPRELQRLLSEVVIHYGGQLTVLLFKEHTQWVRTIKGLEPAAQDAAVRATHLPYIAPDGTGPP